jgi:hypothetical protein
MSSHQNVNERKTAVENTGCKWGLIFVMFALLIDVMYRSAFRNEAAWDLLALASVPGVVCTVYQAWQKTVGWAALRSLWRALRA